MKLTKKEFRQKWVEALRSGEYQQGNSLLHGRSKGQNYFCCLGVACDLYNQLVAPADRVEFKEHEDENSLGYSFYYTYDDKPCSLPPKVQHALGLLTPNGYPSQNVDSLGKRPLSDLNDSSHYSFLQLADYIEQQAGILFEPDEQETK
jgi:hypothetical protein